MASQRRCCVPRCTSSDQTLNSNKSKLSYHPFPVEERVRKAWMSAIFGNDGNNSEFQITYRNPVVCRKHFVESDIQQSFSRRRELLKPGAVPQIFSRPMEAETTAPWLGQEKKSFKTADRPNERGKTTTTTDEPTVAEADAPRGQVHKHRSSKKLDVKLWQQDHDYSARNYAGFTPEERLEAAAHYIATLEQRALDLQAQRFCLERFSADPDLVSFYTGFPSYQTARAAFQALRPTAERMARCSRKQCHRDVSPTIHQPFCHENLALIDQYFLFLVKLRRGPADQDLAYRFAVSLPCVRQVVTTWADYLYAVLREMPIWASRSQVSDSLPACFRALFPKTRVIVHAAALRVEKPLSPGTDSATSPPPGEMTTTCKGLLGISPTGAVSCVSNLFPAPISNEELAVRSGIAQLLDPGDQVLVEEHFPVAKELQRVGASLVVLPSPELQYSVRTQHIERLQSHVRRAIQRVSEFYVFDNIIPSTMAHQLWTICCLLTNFQGPLR